MEDVAVAGGVLDAWDTGAGEPVLLIHGALAPDVFGPMIEQPVMNGFRFIGYRRRGYHGQAAVTEPSIEAYAADAVAVLDHFGIDRAHVVAHSFGGRVALELAHQAPDRLCSMTLLEGGAVPGHVAPSAQEFGQGAGAAAAAFREGDKQGALEHLLVTIGGENSRAELTAALGDAWFDQAIVDIDTVFANDLGSSWALTKDDLSAIGVPSLVVIGDASAAFFQENSVAVAAELSDCETVTIGGANHWLQITTPETIAPPVADFLGRHPTD